MSSNRTHQSTKSSRLYDEHDEDFSNVYTSNSYRTNNGHSSSHNNSNPTDSNQRWAVTDSLNTSSLLSKPTSARKAPNDTTNRSSLRSSSNNNNNNNSTRASFTFSDKYKSTGASSAKKSKAYKDMNIWGLLEKSYRSQDSTGETNNTPKLYFDGTSSDSFHAQEAVEITSFNNSNRHTSYLKQLDDFLQDKELEADEQLQEVNSKQKPSKPQGKEKLTKNPKRMEVKKAAKPQVEYASSLMENRGNTALIGGMTLEELAQLPLDLSDNSHLDIIDSEINAFYERGYDQPMKAISSLSRTLSSNSSKKTGSTSLPHPPLEEDQSHSISNRNPPPAEITQAKSSLSLLKSKIKQVNSTGNRALKPKSVETNSSDDNNEQLPFATNVKSNEVPQNFLAIPSSAKLNLPHRSPPPFSAKEIITPSRITPRSGSSLSSRKLEDENRGGLLDEDQDIISMRPKPNESGTPETNRSTSKKPQSLQEIMQQKQNQEPQFSQNQSISFSENRSTAQPVEFETRQSRHSFKAAEINVNSSLSSNPYEKEEFEDEDNVYPDEANLPQQECPDCGRKFIPSAFQKHVKICAKVFLQKRKKFDSTKQRLQGEGVDPELKKVYEKQKKEEMKAKKMGSGTGSRPQEGTTESKWKQQSEAFREAMKAARDYAKAKENGQDLPPPKSAPDPSLVPCPHCGRRFSQMAADRHIPQCQNIRAKPTSLKRGGGTNASIITKPKKF